MEKQRPNWNSKSLVVKFNNKKDDSLSGGTGIEIPSKLKNFYLNFIKNSSKQKTTSVQNTKEYSAKKPILNLRELFVLRIPHTEKNKNGKVCVIRGEVLQILIKLIFPNIKVKLETLFNSLLRYNKIKNLGCLDYKIFTNQVKSNQLKTQLRELFIVDCRFDYEFKDGHIEGAINISDPSVIDYLFVKNHCLFLNSDFLDYFQRFRNTGITLKKAISIVKNYLERPKKASKTHKRVKSTISSDQLSKISQECNDNEENTNNRNIQKKDDLNLFKRDSIDEKLAKFNTDRDFDKIRRKGSGEVLVFKKEIVIIFYCEFSSKRAPDMYNFLRSKDREKNLKNYPSLFYPKTFLLDGGYSEFVFNFPDFCVGRNNKYTKMLSPSKISRFHSQNKLLLDNWRKYRTKEKKKAKLICSLFSSS